MDTDYGPWTETIGQMLSGWRAEEPSDAQITDELYSKIHEIIALQVGRQPGWEQACADYVKRALDLDRPAWAASGRAVWASGLWHHGDEDSATLQLVLAELDLQDELQRPRPEPVDSPTGVGGASNNLGVAYTYMRAYELGIPHFRRAMRESLDNYGPSQWLQRLIDQANLAETLLRQALHSESVGRPDDARGQAREAQEIAQGFHADAVRHEREDAINLATTVLIGARSVADPDSIGLQDAATMRDICARQIFGDEASWGIMWVVTSRVNRIVGDLQGCTHAVAATNRTAMPGDHLLVTTAARELALLTTPFTESATWQFADLIAAQAESSRKRAIAAIQTRLRMAGLERRYQEISDERRTLQQRLQESLKAEADLLHAATHDALTGLPNRNLFQQRLESIWEQVEAGLADVAICYVDLDDLKQINDRMGHEAGDAALCRAADRLREIVGGNNTVARLGGDEFGAILLSPGDLDTLRRWADAVNADPQLDGVSLSLGVCLVRARSKHSPHAALAAADEQMYLSKKQGKGTASVTLLS